jgi:hypothetical protein
MNATAERLLNTLTSAEQFVFINEDGRFQIEGFGKARNGVLAEIMDKGVEDVFYNQLTKAIYVKYTGEEKEWSRFFLLPEFKEDKKYKLVKTNYDGSQEILAGWADRGVSYCDCWGRLVAEFSEGSGDYVTPTSECCVFDNSMLSRYDLTNDDIENETLLYIYAIRDIARIEFGEFSGRIGDNYYEIIEIEK